MHSIPYDLRLDVGRMGSQAAVTVARRDRRARLLRVRLFSGANPVPLAGDMLAVLRGLKPDGEILYNDCALNGNAIEQAMTDQMMAAVGLVECELTLYGADGLVLTTPRFDVYVTDTLYADGVIESTDEYTGLTDAMTRLAALEAAVGGAETTRAALYAEVKARYDAGGFDGADGAPGTNGKDGKEGRDGMPGAAGAPGVAGTLSIDGTETVAEGAEAAAVELAGSTPQARRYKLVLPRGGKGAPGAAGRDGKDGAAGKDGKSGTVAIVETITGAAGSKADTKEAAGSTEAARKYVLTVPTGKDGTNGKDGAPGTAGRDGEDGTPGRDGTDGADGRAATLKIGAVTTGDPDSDVQVVNVGTDADAVLDITIPRGRVGASGEGSGDMHTGIYDPEQTGAVNDSRKLGGKDAGYYAEASALAGKAAAVHGHTQGEVTGLDAALNGKAAATHAHGMTDVTGLAEALEGAGAEHTHTMEDVEGLAEALEGAGAGHTHVMDDMPGLADALAGKAAKVHSHAAADVTGLSDAVTDALGDALDGKADAAHTHAQTDVTGLDAALTGKAPKVHGHVAMDVAGLADAIADELADVMPDALAGKADTEHTHTTGDVTGLDAALAAKASTSHVHEQSSVMGLTDALAAKAAAAHKHETADVNGLAAALGGKAATAHTHATADVTGLSTALDGKAGKTHTHATADVTGLTAALDGKSPTTHKHTAADVGAAAASVMRTLTLTKAGWVSNKQTLSSDAILTATQPGDLAIAPAATDQQYQAWVALMPHVTEQAVGSITVSVRGIKPTIDIPVLLEVRA